MNQRTKTKLARGRLLLYVLGFPGVVALDIVTPLGVADWLLEVILVWIASLHGSRRELRAVASVSTVTMLAGLWSSPANVVPFWMGALNRFVAIVAIWTMVHSSERRRAAESKIKILEGLLPICSVCKSIRDGSGEWQRLETYLSANSEARFTHSYCSECADKYMEDLRSELPNA